MSIIKIFDPKILRNIPAGTWVAIAEDQERIVGKGATMVEALSQAEHAGEPKSHIFRVPENDSSLIL